MIRGTARLLVNGDYDATIPVDDLTDPRGTLQAETSGAAVLVFYDSAGALVATVPLPPVVEGDFINLPKFGITEA